MYVNYLSYFSLKLSLFSTKTPATTRACRSGTYHGEGFYSHFKTSIFKYASEHKLLRKVSIQILNLDSLLLHRITVADGYRSVVLGIEIVGHAERCSDLVLTAVSLSDVSAVIKLAVIFLGQLSEDFLRAPPKYMK